MTLQLDTRPALFDAVHWQLRSGFCNCLAGLVRSEQCGSTEREDQLAWLVALADSCGMLHHAEREALARLRHQPDSSLANRDLLWAAHELKHKVADVRGASHDLLAQALRDLLRYLALFVGELLVQLHAKEAEVQTLLVQQLGSTTLKKLTEDLAEVAAFLHRSSESHS